MPPYQSFLKYIDFSFFSQEKIDFSFFSSYFGSMRQGKSSFQINIRIAAFPRNYRMSDLVSEKKKETPVGLYRSFLHDFDLLMAAGKTKEARKALCLSTDAVGNCCCLEFLLLPLIHSYLRNKEPSDFKIFYLLQIISYLSRKENHIFSGLAEKDMIDDLIEESWNRFLEEDGDRFVSLTPFEKIELFRSDFVVFPF